MRIDLAKVRYALSVTLDRCDPAFKQNRLSSLITRAEFGEALVDTNTEQHALLREALVELDCIGLDELYIEHGGL